ncbi:predicted protein [Histoplasma capsulatum var. duboisii H88]|uniref:Predicted protein n=2 Tax=Ajellomyces capsulatus TaxID=5037 RepID=F0U5V3_AJEC8|nr:predicted protein [Histoplasma capsulatum H143]EGC42188.1 predicted protein [Histoplasma capsulatum var. duboisii H88]
MDEDTATKSQPNRRIKHGDVGYNANASPTTGLTNQFEIESFNRDKPWGINFTSKESNLAGRRNDCSGTQCWYFDMIEKYSANLLRFCAFEMLATQRFVSPVAVTIVNIGEIFKFLIPNRDQLAKSSCGRQDYDWHSEIS